MYCSGAAVGIDVPQYTPFQMVPYFTTFLSLHFVGLVGKFFQNNYKHTIKSDVNMKQIYGTQISFLKFF